MVEMLTWSWGLGGLVTRVGEGGGCPLQGREWDRTEIFPQNFH